MLPVQGMASSSLRACTRQLCHSPACACVLAVCSKPTPPVPMVGQECRGPRDLLSTSSSTTPRRPRSAGSWRRATEATVPREGDHDGGDSFDMVRRRLDPAFARASHSRQPTSCLIPTFSPGCVGRHLSAGHLDAFLTVPFDSFTQMGVQPSSSGLSRWAPSCSGCCEADSARSARLACVARVDHGVTRAGRQADCTVGNTWPVVMRPGL